MAWTNPRTWVSGEVVTAALLNTHLRDNLLMVGPTGYVADFTSAVTYNSAITATAMTTIPNGGPYSVTVPVGRSLEVEFHAPLVDVPAGTGLQIQILIGTTQIAAGYWSNSGTASFAMPALIRGFFVGTGAAVDITVQALKLGPGAPSIQGLSLGPVRIQHILS